MTQYNKTAFPIRKTAIASALALMAAPAMANDLVLEETIVTAQKRVENVQDIAATVNVVSGDDIDKFAAFDFTSLQQQTAGLTLSQPNARNNTISMRGVSVDPESGVSSAVDVYWNDAVVRSDVAFNQMYDLERIEILRGPQGTLQGRASPGGAINMITRGASMDATTGYLQGSVSDNNGYNAQAAVNTPLVDELLAVRVAGVFDTNNGADVENVTTGFDDQQLRAYSGRLSTLWQPTDSLDSKFVYQYLDRNSDDPKAMMGVDAAGLRPTLDKDAQTALADTDDYGDMSFTLANLTMDWEVLAHTVTGIVAYQDSTKKAFTAVDRAYSLQVRPAIVAPTWQSSETKTESYSYELRVASDNDTFWNYMVGLYYTDQNTDTDFFANSVTLPIGLGTSTNGKLPVNSNNFAIFTFNTIDLTDSLQLELGLRWTDYENSRAADVYFVDITYLPPALAPIEGLVRDGVEARFPIVGVPEDEQSDTEDAFTGSVALRWDWRDDTNLYASYNRGYRPSGISINPSPNIQYFPDGVNDQLYDEETSDAFEIGSKSTLWDGRATLNTALYYQTFDGYLGFVRGVQVLDDTGAPVDIPGGIVYNGDANIWGVEVEGQVMLAKTWIAGGAMSYSKGEWDGATQPCNEREPGEGLGTCDIDGEPLGGEPEWGFSLNSEYYYPIDDTEVYVRGLFKYTDDRINTEASAGIDQVLADFESYQILDLFVGWRSSAYTWDVSVWAKNVTDEDEIVFQQGPDQYDAALSSSSYTQVNTLSERIIGMTARYNF